MAIKITDECINCGACEPECPNNAIYEALFIETLSSMSFSTKAVSRSEDVVCTRAVTMGVLDETMSSKSSDKSFIQDATYIWNKVPEHIKHCKTFFSAKKAIKNFVLTLPL